MNVVGFKKSNELNLSKEVQIYEDALRSQPKSGNYEWWYFDSKFPDGSSLVIIFYTKHVTSMKNGFSPYVTLDFKSNNHKSIHAECRSNDYEMSKDKCNVRIGKSFIKGDLKHYDIYFNNGEIEVFVQLDSSVPSWRPYSGHIYFNKKDYFAWLPSVPEGSKTV